MTPNKYNNANIRTCVLRPHDPIQHTIMSSIVTLPVGSQHVQTSFVYVSNCAYGHIMTARKLQEESEEHSHCIDGNRDRSRDGGGLGDMDKLNCAEDVGLNMKRNIDIDMNVNDISSSTKNKANMCISGHAFFLSDFDHNFFDYYYILSCKPHTGVRLPSLVLYIWILVVECIEIILHYAFNYDTWQHPITGINSAAYESCVTLTCSRAKATQYLDYCVGDTNIDQCTCGGTSGGSSINNDVGLICRYCAVRNTQNWWKQSTTST